MDRTLYVDLRCLQDGDYRVRGIGHHLTALLRARGQSDFSNWKTIGLVDPRSPKLPDECSSLVDEVTSSINPCYGDGEAVFIDGTPMTHDTRFCIRFVGHPRILSAAVVYDFIPLDWPGYLPTVANRMEYIAKLARLRNFDLFFPVSEYTAWRLSKLLGASRSLMHVTGCAVRNSIYELSARLGPMPSPYENPYFVLVLAADPRKNPQVAIQAVQQLNLLYPQRIALKVVGHYQEPYKRDLLTIAGHAEGSGFLEFYPDISDEEMVTLLRGAIAAIASSHIEGFSLPVVETSVCGCPVIASTCAAHLELIDRPEALFPSADPAALAERLKALLKNPSLRESLLSSQVHLGSNFHECEVGPRLWTGLDAAVKEQQRAVAVGQRRKPWFAFLSPYPPDESNAAFYTAMTMEAGKSFFHSDLYTDTVRPLIFRSRFHDADTISLAPLLNNKYNGVISVLGNSPSHSTILEFFERFGGPCILHDVRLTQLYFQRLGMPAFLLLAARLLGRPVSSEEANTWLNDTDSPSLFIERILERALPLIVHTKTQQALLNTRYGVHAHLVTCCSSVSFSDEELRRDSRHLVRERLGIRPSAFVISNFGKVSRAKGMDTCILTVDFLRSWNIPAELYFIADGRSGRPEMERICNLYGVAEYVHFGPQFDDDVAYRDFLIASDAAVQLRNYDFGKASTALIDCITAGLPCVASHDMAVSCDAPNYVSCVPDHFSPLHVGEHLASMWESQSYRADHQEQRTAYAKTHNFDHYTSRLIEILGVA